MRGLRLAFGYKARSGKDTCAEYLQKKYGGVILKFADRLYEIMYTIQDMTGQARHKDASLLQYLGTQYGRSKDEDMWVKTCFSEVVKIIAENPDTNIFISDLRFPNEAYHLKNAGFKSYKVFRTIENRGNIGRDPNHSSEIALDDYNGWDYCLDNNGTLEELFLKLESTLK